MEPFEHALDDYILGDRMGALEQGLAGSLRLDCAQETYPAAGPVLWSDGASMAVDPGDGHALIISSTGGGKTVSEVMPMLRASIKSGESLFVTDAKSGELYESALPYLEQQGYRTRVVNLREPLRGLRYNPLSLPARLIASPDPDFQARGQGLLDQLGDIIFLQDVSDKDPFWDRAARDIFLGLCYLLIPLVPPERCHLQAVRDLYHLLQCDADTLKRLVDRVADTVPGRMARSLLETRLSAKDSPRTSSSMDAVTVSKFNRFLGTPAQIDLLCGDGLDLESLDGAKTALFLLLPDETEAWSAHASLLVSQVYQYLCLLCTVRHGGTLPHPFRFLLEEFGNLNLGAGAAALFSAGRSRNIRVTAVIQNFSQLDDRYGKSTADTIRFNCGVWVYLHTRDMSTLKVLSDLCGTRTFTQPGVTRSVASVGDLQCLPMGQALIFRGRNRPFLTKLAPIWAYPDTAPAVPIHYPRRALELPPPLDAAQLEALQFQFDLRAKLASTLHADRLEDGAPRGTEPAEDRQADTSPLSQVLHKATDLAQRHFFHVTGLHTAKLQSLDLPLHTVAAILLAGRPDDPNRAAKVGEQGGGLLDYARSLGLKAQLVPLGPLPPKLSGLHWKPEAKGLTPVPVAALVLGWSDGGLEETEQTVEHRLTVKSDETDPRPCLQAANRLPEYWAVGLELNWQSGRLTLARPTEDTRTLVALGIVRHRFQAAGGYLCPAQDHPMIPGQEDHIAAHRFSTANFDELDGDQKCGCFFCGRIFDPEEIVDWVEDPEGPTAVCPHCGVDSILGEGAGFPLTEELLKRMRAYWF